MMDESEPTTYFYFYRPRNVDLWRMFACLPAVSPEDAHRLSAVVQYATSPHYGPYGDDMATISDPNDYEFKCQRLDESREAEYTSMFMQLEMLVTGKKPVLADGDSDTLFMWSQARKHNTAVLPASKHLAQFEQGGDAEQAKTLQIPEGSAMGDEATRTETAPAVDQPKMAAVASTDDPKIAKTATEQATASDSPFGSLEDPIACVWIVKQLGKVAGRSDLLANKLRRRGYPVVKVAGRCYCDRKHAMAMFPRLTHRLVEINDAET